MTQPSQGKSGASDQSSYRVEEQLREALTSFTKFLDTVDEILDGLRRDKRKDECRRTTRELSSHAEQLTQDVKRIANLLTTRPPTSGEVSEKSNELPDEALAKNMIAIPNGMRAQIDTIVSMLENLADQISSSDHESTPPSKQSELKRFVRRARLLSLHWHRDMSHVSPERSEIEIAETRSFFVPMHKATRPKGLVELEPDGKMTLVPPTLDERDAPPQRRRRLKVSVITFTVSHNPLIRAYLLADALRNDYNVEVVGTVFPPHGEGIWKPLQESRVPIKWFTGMDFPNYFSQLQKIAPQLDTDVIIVSKPRLPSLELGILLKTIRNRPLILDIDDYEPGIFCSDPSPLELKQLKKAMFAEDFYHPWGELWTRYCDNLVKHADAITVANPELQKRYGGIVIPQLKDEKSFDPALFDRDRIRAEFGYSKDDRVILYHGSQPTYKGIDQIAAALRTLENPRYKLCVFGADDELRRRLEDMRDARIALFPQQPFHESPHNLCIGDLVCLLQDPAMIWKAYQVPVKFSDALAMAVPILVTNVAPFIDLAERGLVELLGNKPLHEKFDEIFRNYEVFRERARRNRTVFLNEYSYAITTPRLTSLIERMLRSWQPVPTEFRDLLAFHSELWQEMDGRGNRQDRIHS